MRYLSLRGIFIACVLLVFGACNPLDVDPDVIHVDNHEPDFKPARTLSVVFVIDVSSSMVNDTDLYYATTAAVQAAGLLDGRYDNAAVIYYYYNHEVALPLTADINAVRETLLNPPLGLYESKLYPALATAYNLCMADLSKSYRQIILVTDEGSERGTPADIELWTRTAADIRESAERTKYMPFLTVVDLKRDYQDSTTYDIITNEVGNWTEIVNVNPTNGALTYLFRDIIIENRER